MATLLVGAGAARAQVRAFNIPAEPASKAISDFARQSGVQVVAPTRQLRGVTTPAIVGNLDAREALNRLLANTGLEVVQDSGALIVLRMAPAPRVETSPASTPPAPVREAAATIAEIIVTANRDETPASKTPMALAASSGANLAAAGVTNPTQLSGTVPNLTINRGAGLQITIRGVTSADGSEKGDPSAAFLSNGVYIARPQAQEISFFDLERVEVLRGPQGTLYGRNTTAGVVNVISAAPTWEPGATVDVTLGSHATVQATGVANLPVNDDLALRVAINRDLRDTFLQQAAPQASRVPRYKNTTSFRVSALYRPTRRLEVKTILDGAQVRDVQSPALLSNFYRLPFAAPAPGGPGLDPGFLDPDASEALERRYASTQPDSVDNSTWGGLAEVVYSPNRTWSVTWLGAYRAFDRDEAGNTFRGSEVSPAGQVVASMVLPNVFSGEYRQQSHEVRAAYAGEQLKAQAGLYYFREDYDIALFFRGLLGQPGERGHIFGFPQAGWARTAAAFGQATYSPADRWRVTAGLRVTRDDKFRDGATVFRTRLDEPKNFTTTTAPGITNPGGFRDSLNHAELETTRVTWRLGVDVDLTASAMAYATVSTGYKAGGFNDGCLAGAVNCNSPLPVAALFYRPETLTSYEIGLKAWLLGDRLRLNADVFHYDYRNLQLSQLSNICGGPCQVTTNAAKATVDGVEIEGAMALGGAGRLDVAATWLDARYADWPLLPTFNLAGTRLDRSPEWTFAGGYAHTHRLPGGASLVASVRSRYSDRYAILSTVLRARFWQPAFTKTDVSLTYNSAAAWSVQGTVRNLENAVEVTSAALAPGFPGLNNGATNLGDPRTYGIRFSATF